MNWSRCTLRNERYEVPASEVFLAESVASHALATVFDAGPNWTVRQNGVEPVLIRRLGDLPERKSTLALYNEGGGSTRPLRVGSSLYPSAGRGHVRGYRID